MVQDFSRNYSPPGIYIEETESTLVNAVGIPPTLVGLVGPARGYQIHTEQAVLTDAAPTHLVKRGIDATSVKVTAAVTGAVVSASDYSVSKVGSASDQSYLSDFVSVSSPTTAKGTPVFITYRYTDPDYYAPRRFTSFEDVKDVFGEPLNTAVQAPGDTTYQYVTSPLALAAMVAIQNGATEVVLCATTPPPTSATTESAKSTARATALKAAYAKIETDPSVNVLVPVTTGIASADAAGVITDLRSAIVSSVLEGIYCFAVLGFDPTVVDTAPDSLLNTSGAKYQRIQIAFAASTRGLQMYSGSASTAFEVGNQYLAAAYAGRMAALPTQRSLTKQTIAGFSGLAGTPLSKSLKNQYAAAGIAVTEQDRLGRLTVRHGVTTDTTNVNTREASVVRAKDALVTALAEGTATSGLIGSPLDDDLLLSIKSAVSGILENAVADEVIISYSSLSVRTTTTDPSVVEVKFAYKPAYPLNYIVISFSIDMSTGATDLTDDDSVA